VNYERKKGVFMKHRVY